VDAVRLNLAVAFVAELRHAALFSEDVPGVEPSAADELGARHQRVAHRRRTVFCVGAIGGRDDDAVRVRGHLADATQERLCLIGDSLVPGARVARFVGAELEDGQVRRAAHGLGRPRLFVPRQHRAVARAVDRQGVEDDPRGNCRIRLDRDAAAIRAPDRPDDERRE
jgi:hypothetical protein